MTNKKKIWFSLLGLAIAAYSLWLFKVQADFKSFGKDQSNPLEPEGVYHLHSRFSDGRASAEKISRLASQAGLDFIILTDHGRPNFASLSFQGSQNGLFVFAGSELSVNRGHLVGLFFNEPSALLSNQAEEAAWQIQTLQGITIIAHPYSKTKWSWGRQFVYNGLEVVNADSMLRKNLAKGLPYLPLLFLNSRPLFLQLLSFPQQNLLRWDSLSRERQVYGYFATDAHLLYKKLFSLFHLHLILDNPLSSAFSTASQQVKRALKNGCFYNAVEAAAEADGFRFWVEDGAQHYSMGRRLKLNSSLYLRVKAPFDFSFQINIIFNGQSLMKSNAQDTSLPIRRPGVYRVEVYLQEKSPLRPEVPWIISNPIWVEKEND